MLKLMLTLRDRSLRMDVNRGLLVVDALSGMKLV